MRQEMDAKPKQIGPFSTRYNRLADKIYIHSNDQAKMSFSYSTERFPVCIKLSRVVSRMYANDEHEHEQSGLL